MNGTVPVGLVQMACAQNVDDNVDRAVGFIRQAAAGGARIICTQELFKTRYFCQSIDLDHFRLAEEISPEA